MVASYACHTRCVRPPPPPSKMYDRHSSHKRVSFPHADKICILPPPPRPLFARIHGQGSCCHAHLDAEAASTLCQTVRARYHPRPWLGNTSYEQSLRRVAGRQSRESILSSISSSYEYHNVIPALPRVAVASRLLFPQVDYKFMIHHYAGNIVYHTEGFLEKNRDMLHQEGIDLLKSSTSDFVRSFGDR